MRCDRCGRDNGAGARVCSGCGTPLGGRRRRRQGSAGSRLSALDASFLHLERPCQPLNVGLSGIYEGELELADVVGAVRDCLTRVPRLCQKPTAAPFALAQPAWQVEPDFDPAAHVEVRAIRPPGDDRAFARAAGRAMAERLDRSRPLWRIVLLTGLAGGNTGLVWVIHHAMADLLSCFDLAVALHEPPSVSGRSTKSPGGEARSGTIRQAVLDRFAELTDWSIAGLRLMTRPAQAGRQAKRMAGVAGGSAQAWLDPVPEAPWNGPLSPERDCSWVETPMSEVNAVRDALGGTVNDVALAMISGALRSYVRSLGRSVDQLVLRLLCPVSLRQPAEQGSLGNRISWLMVPLDLGIQDPAARLRACRELVDKGKHDGEALGREDWMKLLRWTPPAWQESAGRLADLSGNFNTIATNVRGPTEPLFLAGRKALILFPWAPLASGIGLIHAIGSYDERLFVNTIVDPALLPEPWEYAELLRASFDELAVAAKRAVE